MANITLSTDGYFVAGSTNVNDKTPLVIPATGVANTFTLPGSFVNQVPGGPPANFRFTSINLSSAVQTFAAPTGFTILGNSSLASGATAPTRVTFYYVGSSTWVGF